MTFGCWLACTFELPGFAALGADFVVDPEAVAAAFAARCFSCSSLRSAFVNCLRCGGASAGALGVIAGGFWVDVDGTDDTDVIFPQTVTFTSFFGNS